MKHNLTFHYDTRFKRQFYLFSYLILTKLYILIRKLKKGNACLLTSTTDAEVNIEKEGINLHEYYLSSFYEQAKEHT